MKITKAQRPGDQIVVSLLKPSKLSADGWVKPIGFETNSPPQSYARVPHGPFAVRVMASAPVEVEVQLDGTKVLNATLDKGSHILSRTNDGKAMVFALKTEADSPQPVSQQPTLFPEVEEPQCEPTNGLVHVQVRFTDIGAPRPDVTPDYPQSVFYQMVTPDDHGHVTAGLLMKMKKPEVIPACDDGLVNPNGAPSTATPLPKRFCVTCGHEH